MAKRRYRRDDEGKRRLVVESNGMDGFEVTFTSSCSGCCELGEYNGLAHRYAYDPKASCHIGNGCGECGYTGKRRERHWVPFDYDDAMRLMLEGR